MGVWVEATRERSCLQNREGLQSDVPGPVIAVWCLLLGGAPAHTVSLIKGCCSFSTKEAGGRLCVLLVSPRASGAFLSHCASGQLIPLNSFGPFGGCCLGDSC